jgi:hypothetical protein
LRIREMTSPHSHDIVATIRAIEQATLAVAAAARAGRFPELRQLLARRRELLEGLHGRGAPRERLAELAAVDGETRAILESEIRRVEEGLSRLETGGRVLQGYVVPTDASPAYLDHVR